MNKIYKILGLHWKVFFYLVVEIIQISKYPFVSDNYIPHFLESGKCKFQAENRAYAHTQEYSLESAERRSAVLTVGGAEIRHPYDPLPGGRPQLHSADLLSSDFLLRALSASNDQHLLELMRPYMSYGPNRQTKGWGQQETSLWQDWYAAPFFHSTLAPGFIL